MLSICDRVKSSHDQDSGNDREKQTNAQLGVAANFRSSTWYIVTAVLFATFTDLFIYSAIVPVAPFALSARAGVTTDNVQFWVSIMLAVFNIFSIAASLPCAWISDNYHARVPVFVAGTILQFVGLALLTAGYSIALWISGRAFQGIACAAVITSTLPLLLEAAPKEHSGRYFGMFSLTAGCAVFLGPLLGGVLYDRCGYYSVFTICYALNAIDLILRLLIIERKTTETSVPRSEDSNTASAKDSHIKADVVRCPTTMPTEVQDANPLHLRSKSIVLELLRSSRMLAALYGALLFTAVLTAFDATLPLFVEATFGWTSLGGGLVFVPLLIPNFFSPVFGWLADRYSARWICAFGLLFATAPIICLRFVTEDTTQHKVLLCALLTMVGTGVAAVSPAVMAEVGAVAEQRDRVDSIPSEATDFGAVTRAYALFNVAFSGGCLVGPLWGGLIRDNAGWSTMTWTLGLLWISGMGLVVVWLR